MRRSVVAVLLALFAVPHTLLALGLGEISLQSALNEPFAAEIPVESFTPADFDSLQVQLASGDTFARYGIDQPAFLQGFRFETKRNAGGGAVVRVTSLRPVSEPFVTVLLDARWASGRLLREYTVLLDPPVYTSQPVASGVMTPASPRAAAPVLPAPAPAIAPPPPALAAAPIAASAAVVPREQPLVSDNYRVQQRDTLWGIAQRARSDSGLTTNQVMLALYQANPEAFMGNINRLKAGAILRIPPQDELAAILPQAAAAEVREQHAQFSGGLASAASEPARLQLVPPADESPTSVGTDAAASVSSGLGSAEAGQQLRGRIGELEQALGESQRLLQVRDSELQVLQRRLAAMEQQASGAGEIPAEPFADELTEVAQQPRLPLPGDAPELTADELPVAELAADGAAADTATELEPPVAQVRPDPLMVVAAPERPSGSFFGNLLGNIWLWLGAAAVVLLALFVARWRKQAAVVDQSGDWRMEPEAGADATVVEGDRDYAETIREFRNVPPDDTGILVEEDSGQGDTSRNDVVDFLPGETEEDLFADPFAAGDVEAPLEKTISTGAALNLDQADPIAEAEFHMAYGLYDQAAELLERSLAKQPTNRAFRTKLIEVYFVWENRQGFMKQARLLHDAVSDSSDSDWTKVAILGKQLCPDEALFQGAATPMPDSMDFELDDAGGTELDVLLGDDQANGFDSAVDHGRADDELGIDFGDFGTGVADKLELDISERADSDTLETPTVQNWIDEPTVESASLGDNESDLGAVTMETPTLENPMNEPTLESPTLESVGAAGATSEMPALNLDEFNPADIDFGLGGTDDLDVDLSGITDVDGEADATLLAELDISFDDLPEEEASDTVEQPHVEAESGDTAEQPAILSGRKMDIDLNFEDDDVEVDISTAIAPAGMLPDDATMTEVGTKLDLARAYIDMGDPEGARSILNEVLDEGGTEQQQEARQLLEELDD